MVRNGDAGQRPSTKVIDSEFAFYGPVGFDIGALWGNYVIAAARALAFRDESRAAWCLALIRETWDAFAREFRALWPSVRDPRVFRESTREAYLSKVQTDAWGFAAAKAARVGWLAWRRLRTLRPSMSLYAAGRRGECSILLASWLSNATSQPTLAPSPSESPMS